MSAGHKLIMIAGEYGYVMLLILIPRGFELEIDIPNWTAKYSAAFGSYLAHVSCSLLLIKISNNFNQWLVPFLDKNISGEECLGTFQKFLNSLSEEEKFWGYL